MQHAPRKANHQEVGGADEGGIGRSSLDAARELGPDWPGSPEQEALVQQLCDTLGLKPSAKRVRCWRHVVNQRHRCSWRCHFPAEPMFDHWSLFVRPNGAQVLLVEPYLGRHDDMLGYHAPLDATVNSEIDAWCDEHGVKWCQLPMLSPYLPGWTVPIVLFAADGWDPLAMASGKSGVEWKEGK